AKCDPLGRYLHRSYGTGRFAMLSRRLSQTLIGSALLAVLVGGAAGCSSLSGSSCSSCGIGLGRPLLSRFHSTSFGETQGYAAHPVPEATTSQVINGQPCACCHPCQSSCHFTLLYWPFSWHLFNRCDSCSTPIMYAGPETVVNKPDGKTDAKPETLKT